MAWRNVKLGQICKFKYGEMPKTSDLADEGYPVFSGYRRVGSAHRYHYSDPEIIVVARGVGGTGDVKMTPPFCFLTNLSIAILIEDPEVLKAFLYYRLSSTTLWELRTGSAQAQITIERLKDYELQLPTLPVQRRIASILSAYDRLIENNQRRIKILEAMARALYREWFVHFRFPGHQNHPRVASPLGHIPKTWEVKPLESFCRLVTRGVTPKYQAGSGRFIINQKVNRGTDLSLSDLKELDTGLEVPPEKFARFGDVLVNCLGEGTIGRVHFYTEVHQDWAVDQHMSICRAAQTSDALYVYFAMESEEGQGRVSSLKTGGTNMTMFNISALRSFALVSPPGNLLARFAERALPMLIQKQALTELNRNLRRTRDLLLPRLLSGQLELQEH